LPWCGLVWAIGHLSGAAHRLDRRWPWGLVARLPHPGHSCGTAQWKPLPVRCPALRALVRGQLR